MSFYKSRDSTSSFVNVNTFNIYTGRINKATSLKSDQEQIQRVLLSPNACIEPTSNHKHRNNDLLKQVVTFEPIYEYN